MLPLEVIKKYYPNATEEELKQIQDQFIFYVAGSCNTLRGQLGREY
jgi:hypothetical protein